MKINTDRWRVILFWIGGIGTVLSVIFAFQEVFSQLSELRESTRSLTKSVESSKAYLEMGDHQKALAILIEADKNKGIFSSDENDLAKLDIAMLSIRNMVANQQKGSFTDQLKIPVAVLTDAIPEYENSTLADIYAHLGWASFLKFRDGDRGVDPAHFYQKALDVDPANVFANTMYAHWLYWNRNDLERANTYFERALSTGSNTKYVRRIQYAALNNFDSDGLAFLTMMQDMKARGEIPEKSVAHEVLQTSFFFGPGWERFFSFLMSGKPLASVLEPKEEQELLQWLIELSPSTQEQYHKRSKMIHAILAESAGDRKTALALYTQIYDNLPDSNGTPYDISDALRASITRTEQ
jgi:tetratricopeptide (TPR) repeat protein